MPRFRMTLFVRLATLAIGILIACAWILWQQPRQSSHSTTLTTIGDNANAFSESSWPQLRGPTFDSHSAETGLAESWPETGPPVIWTRELGQGYSSFAAVGKRVFTLTQSLYRQSAICLDAETGDTIWSNDYDWPYDGGGLYPGPRSTPTVHGGRVYFAAPDGMIGCLNAADGRSIWSCNPKKVFHGRGTDFGYASSPVVVDGKVIVPVGGTDASVVALNTVDGAIIWKSGESSASYASPLPIVLQGRSLVVMPLENSVAAFDVELGKKLWEIEFSQGYDEHSAAPIFLEPYLMIASPFRAGAKRYRLVGSNADTSNQPDESPADVLPKVTWETPKFSNDVASSVLVNGRVYGFDLKDPQSRLDRPSRGEFRCLDFETGMVIWSTDKIGQANVIVADQKLLLFTDRGELILARSGTDEYVELARTQVFRDETCWTYPSLHRGCVYLRTQRQAACIYIGNSTFASRRPTSSVSEIPRGHFVDAKWLIGGEREFPAMVPEWTEFRTWYLWSVVCLILASFVAILISFGTRLYNSPKRLGIAENSSRQTLGRIGFWLTLMVAGVIGSPVINARQSDYVLMWPLALWASFQLAMNVITWTERRDDRRRCRWRSRVCGLIFLAMCATYFHLCRSLGYAIEWSFLVGFLPGFVIAAVAARFLTTQLRFWLLVDFAVSLLSFSAYFWSSVLFIKWKMVVGS